MRRRLGKAVETAAANGLSVGGEASLSEMLSPVLIIVLRLVLIARVHSLETSTDKEVLLNLALSYITAEGPFSHHIY